MVLTPNMAKHNDLGEWGEGIARDYLITQGYTVAEMDKTIGRAEVDIVAFKDDCVHFVEVKTRSEGSGNPLDAITKAKIRRICRFANSYILSWDLKYRPQFDVVSIVGSPERGVKQFEYIPDAFLPPIS